MTVLSRPSIHTPKLCHHKATGQAFVLVNGTHKYLGRYGTAETQVKYAKFIAEYVANGGKVLPPAQEITVLELINAYWKHVKAYYRRPDGSATSQQHMIHNALKPLEELFATAPAAGFGPNSLRAIRQIWITQKLSRRSVNGYTNEIKRMFKWAVSHEMISESIYSALATIENLKANRTEIVETEPVGPVEDGHVKVVKEKASKPIAAMIDLQILTGARSGEIVGLRPCDIDTAGAVWQATVSDHKMRYQGRQRVLFFGPKAQAVLKPFLLRPSTSYLFSPRETIAEKAANSPKGKHRRDYQQDGPRATERVVGDCYTVGSYRRAITRIVDGINREIRKNNKGKPQAEQEPMVPNWHPHQLRHNAGTLIRNTYTLEHAQACLGHASAKITEVYAKVDQERARSVMAEIG